MHRPFLCSWLFEVSYEEEGGGVGEKGEGGGERRRE